MISESELIDDCIKGNEVAYECFYKKYSRKMLGICLRYSNNKSDAEDILQEGFIKVFENIKSYGKTGSFEGWVRKIMINTAINFYKANLHFSFNEQFNDKIDIEVKNEDVIGKISTNELLAIVQELPEGFRIIFNLYAIEGYSHKEIAELLNISESTSRSQLARARVVLQNKINKINSMSYEKRA
jgi:RNA polymerase sigma factor (sigma-70 family)